MVVCIMIYLFYIVVCVFSCFYVYLLMLICNMWIACVSYTILMPVWWRPVCTILVPVWWRPVWCDVS